MATSAGQEAFATAIANGRLSDDPEAKNYAGNFMYMGDGGVAGGAQFKHISTRSYLSQCGKHLVRWSDEGHEDFDGKPIAKDECRGPGV